MKLALSLFWRILVVQFIAGMIMLAGLRSAALMGEPALMPWKPTIRFLIMALALVAAQGAAKFSLVRAVFGAPLALADAFWRSGSFALAVFYLILAIANVAVLKVVALDTWLVYKESAPAP